MIACLIASTTKIVMAPTKVEVEKFNGMNGFSMCCMKMHDLLVTQGLAKIF